MCERNFASLLAKVRGDTSVPVSGGINTSDLYSTGRLWSRRVDSKVHKLDGFPHGVMVLLWREDRKYVHSDRKILRKRKFGGLSPLFYVARKNGRRIFSPNKDDLSYSAWIITVKFIYAPNKNMKFFLLQH